MTTLALGTSWLDPNYLISQFGLIGILAIVFAESGLLIGFFLPGDSLLFTTGLLCADHTFIKQPLWVVLTGVAVAAIAGDQVGYLFGRKVGPSLFGRQDSKLFKQENVEKAHDFFEKYGPRSIILARFVPIVRTFTPIVAGVSRMNYRTFVVYNVIGGILWGCGVTVAGYFLGQVDAVRAHVELILVGIVAVSVIPVVIEVLRARRKGKGAKAANGATGSAGGPAEGTERTGRAEGSHHTADHGGEADGQDARGSIPKRGRHRARSR
ncbi:DedA family protein [Wenjunlia tyrosinilytica]|uniref:VTT domain-containing protein n=1 Tax=Wenjunlia tyrosinilytica TaxID=1544741 RepID=A0A917ZRA8_9ACTN|nr:VTT domain-containing protein [Wenjunlia tyrosinilytica]GGO89449.1 hypothetical protein GCM10012280_32620 [Wenjunlia tyrosinilytica]